MKRILAGLLSLLFAAASLAQTTVTTTAANAPPASSAATGGLVVGNTLPSLATVNGVDIQAGGASLVIGAEVNANTRTDATNKLGAIASPHYTNAATPVVAIGMRNTAAASVLTVGGGAAAPGNALNAVTAIQFYSAANNTTLGGSLMGTLAITGWILNQAVTMPNLATSSAPTTGSMCWTTGTGNINVDTTTTCLLSSGKYKKAERPLDSGLREVLALRPVSYRLKDAYNPAHLGEQIGFFAEDVAKVDTRLVSRDDSDGSPHAVRYQQLTAVLTKAIQEQQVQINRLRREIAALKPVRFARYP